MRILLLLLLSFSLNTLTAEPWGKDADLAKRHEEGCLKPRKCTVLEPIAETLIAFHQDVISPADGPRSHIKPSSSQYTLDAIKKYGFCMGVAMGCDRLMRENEDPWVYEWTRDGAGKLIKYDPVP